MFRSGKDRALEHPVRATLRERIAGAAGPVPLAELAQAVNVPISVADYHVRVLSSCGLVTLDRAGHARLA